MAKADAADQTSAADRYGQVMENRPLVLACCFNLVTAMAQIPLPVRPALPYIREFDLGSDGAGLVLRMGHPALIDRSSWRPHKASSLLKSGQHFSIPAQRARGNRCSSARPTCS